MSPDRYKMKLSLKTGLALVALINAASTSAQYQFSEDFSNTLVVGDPDFWYAQYVNAGGNYNQGDANISNWAAYNAAEAAPTALPTSPNGNYANFYARYDDAGIRSTFWYRNMGGFGGDNVYSANNGEHTMTACYYVNEVEASGADLGNGVSAGLGVRFSGLNYGSWPGDANAFQHSVEIPTDTPRGVWRRLSMTFTLTDAARVDAGVWVNNPVLSDPYISTGVLWDDMWMGFSDAAPTGSCGGNTVSRPLGTTASTTNTADPSRIPTLPLGGLLGLVALMGWIGARRRS